MHRHATPDYARSLQAERVAAAAAHRRARTGDLEALVATATANDASAWASLFSRFEPHLLRVARGQGLSHHEAEDAIQDTWLRLLGSIHKLRDPNALGGWLATTARHECTRTRERAQRERPCEHDHLMDVADPAPPAGSRLDAAARRAELDRALEGLSARDRKLIQALFSDEPPGYREIAELLDIPVGSIGPTRGRCLAKLRLDVRLRQLADELD